MSVFAQVTAALEGLDESWRTQLALRLAKDIDECDAPSGSAALARALRQVMADIAAEAPPKEESTVADELKKRREGRISGAENPKRAAGQDKRRR